VEPLLGNDNEKSSYTTAVARNWLCKQLILLGNGGKRIVTKNNGVTGKRCSLRGPCNIFLMQNRLAVWRCVSCAVRIDAI
jgi:hypothetical protein